MSKIKTTKYDSEDHNIVSSKSSKRKVVPHGGGNKGKRIVIKHHKTGLKMKSKARGQGGVRGGVGSTTVVQAPHIGQTKTKKKRHSRKRKKLGSRLVCRDLVEEALVRGNLAKRQRINKYHRYMVKRRQERRQKKWFRDN